MLLPVSLCVLALVVDWFLNPVLTFGVPNLRPKKKNHPLLVWDPRPLVVWDRRHPLVVHFDCCTHVGGCFAYAVCGGLG